MFLERARFKTFKKHQNTFRRSYFYTSAQLDKCNQNIWTTTKKGKKIGFCGKFYIFAPLINCFALRALPWLGNLTLRQFGIEFLDHKKCIVNYKYNMIFPHTFSRNWWGRYRNYILGSLCVVLFLKNILCINFGKQVLTFCILNKLLCHDKPIIEF